MEHLELSPEALADLVISQALAKMDREHFCRHLALCMGEITARGIPIADLWGAMLGRVEARRDGGAERA